MASHDLTQGKRPELALTRLLHQLSWDFWHTWQSPCGSAETLPHPHRLVRSLRVTTKAGTSRPTPPRRPLPAARLSLGSLSRQRLPASPPTWPGPRHIDVSVSSFSDTSSFLRQHPGFAKHKAKDSVLHAAKSTQTQTPAPAGSPQGDRRLDQLTMDTQRYNNSLE